MPAELGSFDRKTVVWLATIGAGSLLLALYFTFAVSESPEVSSAGADTFSASAIGHRALVDLLRGLDVPLVVSRHNSGDRAAGSAVLVVIEPQLGGQIEEQKLAHMLDRAHTILLILPKWDGDEDPSRPGWLRRASLLPETQPEAILRQAHIAGRVRRRGGDSRVTCGAWTPELTVPQLLETTALEPVIACEGGGILLGVRRSSNHRIFVLSDPDIVSNHGLARGDNAAFALGAIEQTGSPAQTLVIDETLHGHELVPSLWRELFHFPLVLALIQTVLACGGLIFAGMPRFGAPSSDGPAIEPGKSVLIDNTASLLRMGGHSPEVLSRYLERALQQVREARSSTRGGGGDRRARPRVASGLDIRVVEAQVQRIRAGEPASDSVIVSLAQKIYRWREEVLGGSRGRS